MADDEKKIFIDEDWKSQVAREREQARQQQESEPAESPSSAEDAEGEPMQVAEASFSGLVNSLATQGLLALGLIAHPDAQEVYVDIESARFVIDTLMVLREKTQNNLLQEEEEHLKRALADLQKFYVARVQQMQQEAMQQANINTENLRNPEA